MRIRAASRILNKAVLTLALAFVAQKSFAAQPGYVEPQRCAGCHSRIAADYARTGMGRSLARTAGNAVPPQFNGSTFFHDASRELFTFIRRDGAAWIRRSQPGPDGAETNVFEERVDYVFGAGNQAISYLHRTRDNKLTEFPVSWYPESGGHWGMSPAYDRADHPGFSREVNFACMACHNAYPLSAVVSESPGETVFPEQLPDGIDCQRCHGPGLKHVDAASGGKSTAEIRASIVNPARLAHDRQDEVCLQCHLETTSSRLPASVLRPGRGIFSWRPGEALADFMLAFERVPASDRADAVELVSAPWRLAKSACRLVDGTPLTCTTCHDPHLPLSSEESTRKTQGVCLSCHATVIARLVGAGRHTADQACVTCHMPRVKAADVIHASITDHFIAKPRNIVPPTREINARRAAPYAGGATLYYPQVLPQTPDNSLALAIAQVQSNPAEALRRLDQFTANDLANRPEFAAELGHAFLLLAQPQKAIIWYRQALNGRPDDWTWLAGLGNAQQAAGRPDLAAEAFSRAAALAPWETDILFSLAQARARMGQGAEAVRILREAVSRNPESAAAFNDLGSSLLRMANGPGATDLLREAETAWREAVRIQPDFTSLRMNLADALLRQDKLDEARRQLDEAIRIGGRAETSEGAWFAALVATGSVDSAAKAWAGSFASQVAGAHNNLGTMFASQNKPEEALREYRLSVEGDPQSALAQFNLGLTLFERGLKAEAMPHLTKAAESDNPGLRAAALSLLQKSTPQK